MKKKIGFIGCGNMATAMISGIINSNVVSSEELMVSNPTDEKLKKIKQKCNVNISNINRDVASFSDILFLSVKPNKYEEVINEIKNSVKENCIIVAIAAGITIKFIESKFDKKDLKVVRTMPNTPALVGEGMTAISFNSKVTNEEKEDILSIFKSFGKYEVIDEKLMDVIPAISGSSPAYVYMFIEALADGAVLGGIPRDKAYKMAAQAVLGSAKMVLETGEHPGVLKDNVCSPGGTTIEAVYTLEKNNFRGTIIEAMESCTKKTKQMSGSK